MIDTSARLLRLLSLLQTPRPWTGPQLAERLGVTGRTVRNDIGRLRSLGYPVEATPGATGGYRLGAGTSVPPLLLDDEEAVAIAVGLRTAAGGGVSGIEEAALRSLAKLDQVLPSRLRYRVAALHDATATSTAGGPAVEAEVLTAVATAIRVGEQLRFDYRSHDRSTSNRSVEPHRLVHTRGRWYLVAWDPDRDDWRTFRADRITVRSPNGSRFTPREPPGGDVVGYLERVLGTAVWQYRERVTVHAPAERVAQRVPPSVVVEPVDQRRCHVHVGSDSPHQLALWVGMIDEDFEVDPGSALAEQVRSLAERYRRAAGQRPASRRSRTPAG